MMITMMPTTMVVKKCIVTLLLLLIGQCFLFSTNTLCESSEASAATHHHHQPQQQPPQQQPQQQYYNSTSHSNHKDDSDGSFRESVVVKPLLDGKVLLHFQFITQQKASLRESGGGGGGALRHYTHFPKMFGQVVDKYQVQELHLSFTQGRWQYDKWGNSLSPAPAGAELMTWFNNTNDNMEQQWKGLVNALSGLFCASLNFLDTTTEFSYAAGVVSESQNDHFRYGTLSHETVCTENLTPFKQLLPSRAKAGIGSLLNPIRLYDTHFHSMGVHFRRKRNIASSSSTIYELTQTVSVVFDLESAQNRQTEGDRLFRDWTLSSILGLTNHAYVKFPLAAESTLLLDISPELQNYFNQNARGLINNPDTPILRIAPEKLVKLSNNHHRLSIAGFEQHSLYEVNLLEMESPVNDIAFKWVANNVPVPDKYQTLSVVTAQRYETGYGQLEGGLVVNIQNNDPTSPVVIRYYEAIPWYFKLYFHTLKMKVNGKLVSSPHTYCSYFSVTPSKDRQNSAVLELAVHMEPQSNLSMSIEFDKAFLKYTEHSPDANRGFDLSSSVISYSLIGSANSSIHTLFDWQPVLTVPRQEDSKPILINTRVYTESLLITLPKPDFSMPYNVITLSSTIIALFFGSLFNVLIRRFELDMN